MLLHLAAGAVVLLLCADSAVAASTRSRHRLGRRAGGTVILDGSSAVIDNSTSVAYAWKLNQATPTLAKGLSNVTMAKVKQNLAEHSSDSWVSGTRAQAILEFDHPTLSVFSNNYFGRISAGATPSQVTDIAKYWLDQLPADAQQFVLAGAAGDTASVGVAFVSAIHDRTTQQQGAFETFSDREVNWLLKTVPRMPNGALSHRPPNEQAQVWADNIYMSPPFLAYYGVAKRNMTVAKEAFTQISAYRDILRDPSTNLWMHIKGGTWEDTKQWGTGVGWALAGMVRVYATYHFSPFIGVFDTERTQLAEWSNELVEAALPWISSGNLLPNVYGQDRGFDDAASSALIAAAIYRMGQLRILRNETSAIAKAEQLRQGVYAKLSPVSSWMDSCADPFLFYTPTDHSPESMAFLMLLEAAATAYRSATKG